jgi:hypothetical protein
MQPDPNHDKDSMTKKTANPGFAVGQLAAAFRTSRNHPDPNTRERAVSKIQKWLMVLRGMTIGNLSIGSRTPLSGTPAWATLEVIKGGFATGSLLAEGPLQGHEVALLEQVQSNPAATPRAILNAYYLSDEGIEKLQQMLHTGCYRINVPEEAALLVIAWLLDREKTNVALSVLDEIRPYLDRLRFYPVPADEPLAETSLVHLQSIAETISDLKAIQVPMRYQVMREALTVWSPMLDRAVDLFLETVEGAVPSLKVDDSGKPIRLPSGAFSIEGGWPCQRYGEGWRDRANLFLAEYDRLREQHHLSTKPDAKGSNFAILRGYLKECASAPTQLTGRDVGRIRSILAHILTSHGRPDSLRGRALRERQRYQASRPTRSELATVVIDRLAALPPDGGLVDLTSVLAPVSHEESERFGLPPMEHLAQRLDEKVRRCLLASVEDLVKWRVIPSAETLARVIPQITSHVAAAAVADLDLRRVYSATYQAFRRRRSLLLLNLASQVKFSELPWVHAVEQAPQAGRQVRLPEPAPNIAWTTLERVYALSVTSFPQQILPNKLLQEIRAMAKQAGLKLPLVDELAADIFMGAFTENFLRSAQRAGRLLQGTLYERYYGISYAAIMPINDIKFGRHGVAPTSPSFYKICAELAGPRSATFSVAENGKVIEQEQILTTHNLATLFDELLLTKTLRPRLVDMAKSCFVFVCRRQQQPIEKWKSRLRMLKNTAYAWRQMMFYLSLVPDESEEFVTWAQSHLDKQRPGFRERFQPAINGLALCVRGGTISEIVETASLVKARRFLGWATQKHWLLE